MMYHHLMLMKLSMFMCEQVVMVCTLQYKVMAPLPPLALADKAFLKRMNILFNE